MTVQDQMRNPLERMRKTQEDRRQTRMKFMDDFKTARDVVKQDLIRDEGDEIMEQMK